jgi:phosphoribosylformylglycinamidine synthase
MVGRLPDAARAGRLGFARAGDRIALVGPFAPSLDASELAKLWGRPLPDGLPVFDVPAVVAAQQAVRDAVRAGELSSAHDIAEGGLAVALVECCLAGGLGADVVLDPAIAHPGAGAFSSGEASDADAGDELGASRDAGAVGVLFGEGSGGFLVSGSEAALAALAQRVQTRPIGEVGGEDVTISIGGEAAIELPLERLRAAHEGGLAGYFP